VIYFQSILSFCCILAFWLVKHLVVSQITGLQ